MPPSITNQPRSYNTDKRQAGSARSPTLMPTPPHQSPYNLLERNDYESGELLARIHHLSSDRRIITRPGSFVVSPQSTSQWTRRRLDRPGSELNES